MLRSRFAVNGMALPYAKYQGEGGGPTGTTAHSVFLHGPLFLEFFQKKKIELNKSKGLILSSFFSLRAEVQGSIIVSNGSYDPREFCSGTKRQ